MVAIIPARGGSKGVPKKNIRPLAGKPLIYWTIEAAQKSKYIDNIILSTDDEEIVKICKPTGIDIPFIRPAELAKDDSLAIDNYIYTVDRLNNEFNHNYKEFVILLPTVPLRNSNDIDSAIKLFVEKDADSVIAATPLHCPAEWLFSLNDEKIILKDKIIDVRKTMNRQESSFSYAPNGAIYIFNFDFLRNKYSYYSEKSYAYIMPAERSVDIDTEYDFEMAEYFITK
tara:strand:+ start:188 stop:871 length:684 start_codon:yes stop_codon:yes gene_type:complete